MDSVEQFVDKLASFARLVADNADRDVVLAAVAVGIVVLLLLVIALRSTVYRNLDRSRDGRCGLTGREDRGADGAAPRRCPERS